MKRYYFFFILLIFSVFYNTISAQISNEDAIISQDSVILEREFTGGIVANTHGIGGILRFGKNLTVFKRRSLEFEIVSLKNAKQYKMINPYFLNAKSFYYGKLNQVYLLKVGVSEHRLISRKPYWGGIELRYFYSGGLTLGIAKPIHLYIVKLVDQQTYEKKSERYDPELHSIEDIHGRAPFIKGLNEIKIYPGAFLKAGVSFELAGYKTKPHIVELGMGLDFFPVAIPIMAFNESNVIYFSLFVNYQFGKRYNKI